MTVKNGAIDIYESQYVKQRPETAKKEGKEDAPSFVTNVEAKIEDGRLLLQWSGAKDDKTPTPSLTYDVAVGSAIGFWNILPGEVGPGQISPRKGNVLNSTRIVLPLPEDAAEIHYGIQAIDSGLKKGEWVFGSLTIPSKNGEHIKEKERKGFSSSTHLSVLSITKVEKPFKIIVKGRNFKKGVKVFINGSSIPCSSVGWKSKEIIIIKKHPSFESFVLKDTLTTFKFVNPDGESTIYEYRR